ncbi:MAG: glycosyltransferase family 4 protein [Rhizobacter sp.]|nr:glycosyltransferase family 4 protein [Rhizobacter sp.]
MRILLVNHYAGSLRHGMEFRPFYLAREWAKAGHEVLIVAASQSHLRSVAPRLEGGSAREQVDGVDYLWLRTPAYRGNGVGRVLNIAVFCLRLGAIAKRLARGFRPDVVIASSTYPMDIWPARRIARAGQARLVHEIHDLWPLSPVELGGMSPRHPFIRVCQAAEDAACRDADLVVSMLPCVHEHLRDRGLDLRKLHIVPNGVLVAEWSEPAAPLDAALAAHIQDAHARGRLVVVYAGAHGIANALDSLLDAAALLRDEAFSFVLVGSGAERERLAARVDAEDLASVRLFDPIAKRQIPSLLAQADIAYISLQRVPIFRFGIAPNKLMDYMMAGCAVLCAIDAGNDPVAEADCGVTVQAESAPAIAQGLRQLAARSADERRAMGARGREYVRRHHDWSVLAERFIEAVS